MEVYLFALLLTLSLSLFYSRRYALAGLALGLLFLTRGEGVLALLIVVIVSLTQQWPKLRRRDREGYTAALSLVGGFALPVVLWLAYAYPTFGALLPNTLAAKRAQGQFALTANPFLQRLVTEWAPVWPDSLGLGAHPLANVWWLLVAVGVAASLVRRLRWRVFLVWLLVYSAGYTLVGVSAAWWYQYPALFVLQLFFALGVTTSAWFLARRLRPRALGVGIAAALLLCVSVPIARQSLQIVASDPGDPRAPGYLALAQWLRENTDPGESVAYMEIGYLGYYTQNRIVDLAGLVLPDIAPHVAMGDFAWGFWRYAPDYYVDIETAAWALASGKADPRFAARYRPVAELPALDGLHLTIYKAIPSPKPSASP